MAIDPARRYAYTVKEAAKYLGEQLHGMSEKSLYRLVEKKEIEHVRIGGRLLFSEAGMNAWIESRRQAPVRARQSTTAVASQPAAVLDMPGARRFVSR